MHRYNKASPMRILHVIPSMNLADGGPINWTICVSRELAKLGHVSEVATIDDPAAPWVASSDVVVHALGPGNKLGISRKVGPWIAQNHRGYDFVVLHTIFEHCCYAAWREMRRDKNRLVTFVHGFLDPYFNRAYPLKKIKKYLFWPWAIYPQLRDAAVTLFTTEEERILARQSFRPYRCNERVIAYGITKPQYDREKVLQAFHSAVPEVEGRPFLLYLSRIHPKKGVDLLIQAFAKVYADCPEYKLVIAGPDQVGIVAGLKELAQSHGVADRIIWPGMLNGDVKWGAFEACQAFTLPSHQENFGQVVAEAMSCSKPVLISNKVNIYQEVASSGGGIVENDDLEGTNKAFSRFKALSEPEVAAMGRAALSCFHEKFELEQSAKDFIRVLEEAAKSR